MSLRPSFLVAALVLGAPAAASAASSGNILLVGPGKPFTTIQAAVDASVDGDSIRVYAGTYNESVVIAGKQRLTVVGAAPESTLVLGTSSHAIQIMSSGGLTTAAPAGDTQARAVGRGQAFSTCVSTGADNVLDTAAASGDDQVIPALIVNSGPNGICETTADPNDVQALPVGQGTPNTSCVGAGVNGMLETAPSGDDVATAMPVAINSGPDGICNSMAVTGDDVRNIDTNTINSGANGICTTTAAVGDVQTVPVGSGDPNGACVTAGQDGILNTSAATGDDVLDVPNKQVKAGPNWICDTTAAAGDVQAVPVGLPKPNGACVTAGTALKRGRQVKIQGFTLRAPDGFDALHVERSDFVDLSFLTLDAGTRVFNGVCTAAGAPYTCCTGPGAGKCAPNNACTAASTPFSCCSGKGAGNCASNDTCTGAGVPLACCTGSMAGTCVDTTGRNGIFVDFTAVKPLIKSCTARRQPASGFFIEGPGAEVTSNTAEGNLSFGFASFQSSDSAVYTGNVATGNAVGFGIAGQGNIVQRCTALGNSSIGFEVFGVGNILYQVVANQNGPASTAGVGIESTGRGTRIRNSTITGNSGFGIFLTSDANGSAEGSEVFANFVRDNLHGGIVDEAFGVVMKQNTVEPLGSNRQDVGILLREQVQGTLLESNIVRNNRDFPDPDSSLNYCAANALCDLVNQGTNNAGKLNQFSPAFAPPPGFQ